MTFPIGTSVRIHAPGYRFPWRDHRQVKFDAPFHNLRAEYVPVVELRAIKLSDRPAEALPVEKRQLGLFGEAA